MTVLLVLACARTASSEIRGLWIVRDDITTPEKIREIVSFADENGYTDLFVQVRGRGDAFYRSAIVPAPESCPGIPDRFDPLGFIIPLAHARGIAVHAWINMYLTWSADTSPGDPRHPLNAHPEWFMTSLDGLGMAECPIDSVRNTLCEGRYMSPVLDPVRQYLSNLITELLVSYPVDGIHLDYVRYPGRVWDFGPAARDAFIRRFGEDPAAVVRGDVGTQSLQLLGTWVIFRASFIDDQVRDIRRRIDLIGRPILFSAAVKPHGDEAYFQYGQNWIGWLNEGIMDFVATMGYTDNSDLWAETMRRNIQAADPGRIVGGIGAYRVPPETARRQIALSRELGLAGYAVFSYATFRDDPGYAVELSRAALDAGPGASSPVHTRCHDAGQ